MSDKIPATGERAAMGGYLPQFDEFAWFVYLNLINKNLEWIRIADHKAEKLDDIQYSTYSEIHAYQVKWTIADANISFTNFVKLFPLITSSWQRLKVDNPSKKIIPHLITNKSFSSNDSIKNNEDTIIGSFKDFITEGWMKLKANQDIDKKWTPIFDKLKKISNLETSVFNEFVQSFDFQASYQQKKFSVKNSAYSKEEEDLQKVSRYIVEKVASPERIVEISRQEIIKELGWSARFKTIFNHELIVDMQRYQPIQSTIDLLNSKLTKYSKGYLFLQGGPGSGKSTLLNQWSKSYEARIVKYYAFDFVNPSSHLNFKERGNATHLFFDLVFQIKEAGIYKKDILPYKDLFFLKEVFNEQLKAIEQDYLENKQPTIIIIDGLDHIPREYKLTTDSFLRSLPLPVSLPDGVFIILGSQSYELDDIPQEIKSEFQKGDRTIQIDSLKKGEVYKYIEGLDHSISLDHSQKLRIFEKSQGHPLYLSYLMEKVSTVDIIDDAINSFIKIDGSIDTYYKKIWDPIRREDGLINFLGLIARINGSINLHFVQEWGIERGVLRLFNERAKVLFNEKDKELSFFHNSFKQFLLHQTSLNYLTGGFDQETNLSYHNQLASFYMNSNVENSWKRNYHLFQGEKYDEFILEVTPDSFILQFLDFRPAEEIIQDAKLGIEIAKQKRDLNILIKYLFPLAELDIRLRNIDLASFTEELLILNKFNLARNLLRTGNKLHCKENYAFRASRLFIEYGHKVEGEVLFNLAYPDIITKSGIEITEAYRYEEIREVLEEWIYTSPHFEKVEKILSVVENITFSDSIKRNRFNETESDLMIRLFISLGYSLVDQNKWDDFNKVLEKIDLASAKGKQSTFRLIQYSIEKCIELDDNNRANEYLSLCTANFTREESSPTRKIYIADLIYKVTKNIDETFRWIENVKQPSNVGKNSLNYSDSLKEFHPLIKLNKLLNLCGKGVSITVAIPSDPKNKDDEILIEFERMLCLTTRILTNGILQKNLDVDIIKKVFPIIKFYYKKISPKSNYGYKIAKVKGTYFDFLILAVAKMNNKSVQKLGDYLFNEFLENPNSWTNSTRRKIIKSLLINGFDRVKAIEQLRGLESSMLDNHDIDGRITECLAHSKIWLILNEQHEGEKWLKQAVKESIGVGYSKDYQFSTWIDWLRKINIKDKSNAIKRIKWFLSHLRHIKETTEGRAFWKASEEILGATYEHNFDDGLKQTVWQLDHNLIDFRDAISLFIKWFIIRTNRIEEIINIVQFYNELYLFLVESPSSLLLKSILDKGYEILQQDFLSEYVASIILAININAYEKNRHDLLSEVNNFYSLKGLKIEDYHSDFKIPPKKETTNSSGSSNTLTLKKDQERIDEENVLKQVNTFDDFIKIIEEEDQVNSYFDWTKVIEKMAPYLSLVQIEEIACLDKLEGKKTNFYVILSKIALDLGGQKLALKLANKSIELSSQLGWGNYDGGTRINAFNALRKIDPSLSTDKAFEIFSQDIISGTYPSWYIENLEEIVPLLTEDYEEEVLWLDIYNYLQRLMSNSKPIKSLPILPSSNQQITRTLIDFLVYLSKSQVSIVKERSRILLAKHIDRNDDNALTYLQNQKLDDYIYMDIIMSLFELKSPKIQVLISKIQNFAISKDYQLRENSKHILAALGEDIPVPQKIEIPSAFLLHIPEYRQLEIPIKATSNFPFSDSNNPRELIRPFGFTVKLLSEESGIAESNLIYRIHSIMKKISQEDQWTVAYEKELRSHLEEIHLNFSYTRPRVLVARRAIMHVINELIDSRVLIISEEIRLLLRSHDYASPIFDVRIKPTFIQTIAERKFGGVKGDWLDRISGSEKLSEPMLNYDETFKIIAEYTRVKNLGWSTPTEEYMFQLSVNGALSKKEDSIFNSVFNQLSSDYHELEISIQYPIVVRDHRFDQFDMKSKWIAINPALARHLEWKPEPAKMFAWKNSHGKLMAESIYWANGNFQLRPHKEGEVGEGWFVIVSEDGFEQIKSIENNLFLQKKLKRSIYEESELRENQTFHIEEI